MERFRSQVYEQLQLRSLVDGEPVGARAAETPHSARAPTCTRLRHPRAPVQTGGVRCAGCAGRRCGTRACGQTWRGESGRAGAPHLAPPPPARLPRLYRELRAALPHVRPMTASGGSCAVNPNGLSLSRPCVLGDVPPRTFSPQAAGAHPTWQSRAGQCGLRSLTAWAPARPLAAGGSPGHSLATLPQFLPPGKIGVP